MGGKEREMGGPKLVEKQEINQTVATETKAATGREIKTWKSVSTAGKLKIPNFSIF